MSMLKLQAGYLADLENNAKKPEDINFVKPEINTRDEMELFSDSLCVMAENLKK